MRASGRSFGSKPCPQPHEIVVRLSQPHPQPVQRRLGQPRHFWENDSGVIEASRGRQPGGGHSPTKPALASRLASAGRPSNPNQTPQRNETITCTHPRRHLRARGRAFHPQRSRCCRGAGADHQLRTTRDGLRSTISERLPCATPSRDAVENYAAVSGGHMSDTLRSVPSATFSAPWRTRRRSRSCYESRIAKLALNTAERGNGLVCKISQKGTSQVSGPHG